MPSLPAVHALETLFFSQDDPRLAESLRELRTLQEAPGLLAEVTGLPADLAATLSDLGLHPAAGLVLVLWPLVEVAWVDGVTGSERRSVLDALGRALFFPTVCQDVVEAWLDRVPSPDFGPAWEAAATELGAALPPDHRRALAAALVESARRVASGVFGPNRAEEALLQRIQKVVSPWL